VTFQLTRLRFHLRAVDTLRFPPAKSGNVLRGAFGMTLRRTADAAEYARIFEPKVTRGLPCEPSGLAEQPRPFVLRAAHLDGRTFAPGEPFHFDAHLFDPSPSATQPFIEAFTRMAEAGFGPGRGRAHLLAVAPREIFIDLGDTSQQVTHIRVDFVTPTELKHDQKLVSRPEFPVLFARLRDRISTLRALYGPGPLAIGFRAMRERATWIRLARCELTWHSVERRSTRTGQTHPLGGFAGHVEYQGDLSEFLPYLRAGRWTGVGRQTVWGKGEICFQVCS
jgi:hypothetical protein